MLLEGQKNRRYPLFWAAIIIVTIILIRPTNSSISTLEYYLNQTKYLLGEMVVQLACVNFLYKATSDKNFFWFMYQRVLNRVEFFAALIVTFSILEGTYSMGIFISSIMLGISSFEAFLITLEVFKETRMKFFIRGMKNKDKQFFCKNFHLFNVTCKQKIEDGESLYEAEMQLNSLEIINDYPKLKAETDLMHIAQRLVVARMMEFLEERNSIIWLEKNLYQEKGMTQYSKDLLGNEKQKFLQKWGIAFDYDYY